MISSIFFFLFLWFVIRLIVQAFQGIGRPSSPLNNHTGYVQSQVFQLTLSVQDYLTSCTFLIMGMMAKAKGRVEDADIEYAEHVMGTMNLDHEMQRISRQIFNYGKNRPELLQPLLAELTINVPYAQHVLRNIFDVNAVLMRSGNDAQLRILFDIASHAGMSDLEFRARTGQHSGGQDYAGSRGSSRRAGARPSQDSLQDAYRLFEIDNPSALTRDELKKRYRRLVKQYHPDRFASSDDKALYEQALRKTQEINMSYDYLCEVHGFSKN